MNWQFRPFELLKLIRDRKVTTLDDLVSLGGSHFYGNAVRFFRDLEDAGLLTLGPRSKIEPTEHLNDVLRALRISLQQLARYDTESIVSSSEFGPPSDPPFDVDVFVLMPFTEDLAPVYNDHVQNVSKQLGLKAARADDFFTTHSIIKDIWDAINSARILIADCTGRNPNVFYELGMAHTLGKPVVLISQSPEDIPFDVKHIRTIIYEYTPRGMTDFEAALSETISIAIEFSRTYADLLESN